ncbi:IucA/IucC family protein [Alkalihalophilus marmarensis]|nr:IucA/IucC family siderophore biosynthesis protein [Alkalihalophilus marmarensis]
MMIAKQIAEKATIQSFLNCYLRETGKGSLINKSQFNELTNDHLFAHSEVSQVIHTKLAYQNMDLFIPLEYWSLTGRHLFSFPLYYAQNTEQSDLLELDYLTLVSLVIKELTLESGGGSTREQDELMMRVILSCQNIEMFVRERLEEADELTAFDMDFIDAEQALLLGHLLHPTPKSRQGISEWDRAQYSPELRGSFQLHYFRVHRSLVYERSALQHSTTHLIKQKLIDHSDTSSDFKEKYCEKDEYSLIPVHPWQADYLMRKPQVQRAINDGLIENLGKQGAAYEPTSSVRTVYHPNEDYMYKFSLNIKITNSVRANKNMELERGVEVKHLLDTEIGKDLKRRFPNFEVIKDPAFITVKLDGENESGFEVILRENLFKKEEARNATPIAALCQDTVSGPPSRLAAIIQRLAEKEGRSVEAVSIDWFTRYLNRSLKPIFWLYLNHGIALEAHQQNSVIHLKDGYPDRFYYRDNQGYYFSESFYEKLSHVLPGISEKSNTVCSDAIADERLRYYFYFNNILGLINAFGVARLVDESILLETLREAILEIEIPAKSSSMLIESLLYEKTLPCKANLLTRFHDMDELTGSLETQSVYVEIDNPLVRKELVTSEYPRRRV